MALISSVFAVTTLPAKTGHFSKTAESMPGVVKSMPKRGLPVRIAGLSRPGGGLPDNFVVLWIFEVDRLEVGRREGGSFAREFAIAEGSLRALMIHAARGCGAFR